MTEQRNWSRAGASSIFKKYKIIGDAIQQRGDFTCLSACGAMAARNPGIQDQLIKILGTGPQSWVNWTRTFNSLEGVGTWRAGDVIIGSGTKEEALAFLMSLRTRWIAIVSPGGALEHAVVVDGFTASGALKILDPADGLAHEVPVKEFVLCVLVSSITDSGKCVRKRL